MRSTISSFGLRVGIGYADVGIDDNIVTISPGVNYLIGLNGYDKSCIQLETGATWSSEGGFKTLQ